MLKLSRLYCRTCFSFSSVAKSNAKHFPYSTLDDSHLPAHLDHFSSFLDDHAIVTDEQSLDFSNTDYLNLYKGHSRVILKPKTTEQVSSILSYANEKSIPIVPQGGNTGLVGGSIPLSNEIVLSLNRMNSILDIDKVNGSMTCEAGCSLGQLEESLDKQGLMLPYDLGAKSSQIGGNIATNAGGLRLLRYGSLRGAITSLQVVLADGSILSPACSLRKNNTGYGLFQHFIGSEGTLGIITQATILTPPKPNSITASMISLASFEDVLKVLSLAKTHLGEILSAFEFMDQTSISASLEHLEKQAPINISEDPYYVLIETQGSNDSHDSEKMEMFLGELANEDLMLDGAMSQSYAELAEFWLIRESVPEGMRVLGKVFKYDLSLPHDLYYSVVPILKERLSKWTKTHDIKVIGYGHVGDGNIHVNVAVPRDLDDDTTQEIKNELEPFVYKWCSDQGGSISAEHGIGSFKTQYLSLNRDPVSINLMRKLKNLYDPSNILNPGKVLPPLE